MEDFSPLLLLADLGVEMLHDVVTLHNMSLSTERESASRESVGYTPALQLLCDNVVERNETLLKSSGSCSEFSGLRELYSSSQQPDMRFSCALLLTSTKRGLDDVCIAGRRYKKKLLPLLPHTPPIVPSVGRSSRAASSVWSERARSKADEDEYSYSESSESSANSSTHKPTQSSTHTPRRRSRNSEGTGLLAPLKKRVRHVKVKSPQAKASPRAKRSLIDTAELRKSRNNAKKRCQALLKREQQQHNMVQEALRETEQLRRQEEELARSNKKVVREELFHKFLGTRFDNAKGGSSAYVQREVETRRMYWPVLLPTHLPNRMEVVKELWRSARSLEKKNLIKDKKMNKQKLLPLQGTRNFTALENPVPRVYEARGRKLNPL